ncbi:peptidase M28 [Nonlabens spongiae]|uniref:Peptidase M28 n=2 Tax=Nonlabens spongiae TaxID=331648 RepID=A0A1W6MM53_9FLAO|nr:peptidase M28 [Nonlabens spongiae]
MTTKKVIFKIMLLFLLVGCKSAQQKQEDRMAEKLRQMATISIPTSSSIQLADDVAYLASDELMGRDTGSEGIEKAATYIEDRFKRLDIKPFYDTYRDNFEIKEKPAFNVVAMMPGSDGKLSKEIVVIGAHYDHIGHIAAVEGDSIANGANDNASGTANVLAIAQILKKLDFNRRTVVFALFSAEEKGLLGSKHLAKRMKAEGHNVVAMLNFEMTGVPMKDSPNITYLTGYDMSNMGEIFNAANTKRVATGKLAKAEEFNLFKRSDNYPFYAEFNIPAQTFCTFDFTNFAHYHKVGDEPSEIDGRHMADVVDALMPGVLNVLNKNELKLTTKTNG